MSRLKVSLEIKEAQESERERFYFEVRCLQDIDQEVAPIYWIFSSSAKHWAQTEESNLFGQSQLRERKKFLVLFIVLAWNLFFSLFSNPNK